MNQKDYKEIAKIISQKGGAESQTTVNYRKFLAKHLAYYFKGEAREECYKESHRQGHKGWITDEEVQRKFNKKQFLLDCGVEK